MQENNKKDAPLFQDRMRQSMGVLKHAYRIDHKEAIGTICLINLEKDNLEKDNLEKDLHWVHQMTLPQMSPYFLSGGQWIL